MRRLFLLFLIYANNKKFHKETKLKLIAIEINAKLEDSTLNTNIFVSQHTTSNKVSITEENTIFLYPKEEILSKASAANTQKVKDITKANLNSHPSG